MSITVTVLHSLVYEPLHTQVPFQASPAIMATIEFYDANYELVKLIVF